MLNKAIILVAEDEPFIALDVALAIEDAGGRVLGPAASVQQALALIKANTVGAAILDVNLTDGEITPVAELLHARGIPMVLQSGVGLPTALSAQFPDMEFVMKPCEGAKLVARLGKIFRTLNDDR